MTRKKRLLATTVAGALASSLGPGCIPPDVSEQGPTVHVKLDPTGFASVTSDTDSDPHLTLDATTNVFEFELIVETRDGKVDDSKAGTENQPVTMVTGTLTVPGQTITDGPYDAPTGNNRTFKRTAPITLPATVQGMMMKVQFQGTCANGLSSNLVDFNVALR